MPSFPPGFDVAVHRQPLLEAYQKLPTAEQRFIQFLAVNYRPVAINTLVSCLEDLGIKDQKRRALNSNQVQQWILRFMRLGVVSGSPQKGYACHALLVELVTRDAIAQGNFDRMVTIAFNRIPARTGWGRTLLTFNSEEETIREIRIAFYQQNHERVLELWDMYTANRINSGGPSLHDVLWGICSNPFDPQWVRTLNGELYSATLRGGLENCLIYLSPCPDLFELLIEDCLSHSPNCRSLLQRELIINLLWQGKTDAVQSLLDSIIERDDQQNPLILTLLGAALQVLKGNGREALDLYEGALRIAQKQNKKKLMGLEALLTYGEGLFYVAALFQEQSATSLSLACQYSLARSSSKRLIQGQLEGTYQNIYRLLYLTAQVRQGHMDVMDLLESALVPSQGSNYGFEQFWSLLVTYWSSRDRAANLGDLSRKVHQQAHAAGYNWIALEVAELGHQCHKTFGPEAEYGVGVAWRNQVQWRSLVNLLEPQEPWQLRLNALIGLNPKIDPATAASRSPENDRRMIWLLKITTNGYTLTPKEQKISAKGSWSKGRVIALKRLKLDPEEFPYLSAQDQEVCEHIETDGYNPYYNVNFGNFKLNEQAILALVGHPLVFWEDTPSIRVDVALGEPEVRVRKMPDDWLHLELYPPLPSNTSMVLWKETPTRVLVFRLKDEHRNIARVLGPDNHLRVPLAAQEQVLSAISAISGLVTVQSDIGGDMAGAIEVEAVSTPLVHLLPAGTGLKVALLVRPFGSGGPYYRPGQGGETVVAEVGGDRLQTYRNLDLEQALAQQVLEGCPVWELEPEADGEWLISDPEQCLELLLFLQSLGDQIILEWPEGETLRIKRLVGAESFQLNIGQQQDWFSASGSLQVSDDLVLNIQQLLSLLEKSPGRFIRLDDGQFLALTESFRKRLEELRSFSEAHGKGLRFHPLAAFALEDLVEEAGSVTADDHWHAHIRRLKEVETLQPELPSTLQAELRDYQVEGFQWLARLAHWGVGACLADDMGLGKTLQALALMLTRANQGPSLIVAPTSVCLNWLAEAQRFAPTLRGYSFGGSDRQKMLKDLQPFDMMVCSYGLLQQEEVGEMLAQVHWQTIVLDEAQAIKNVATKRSKSAMALQGGFKMLTTGTPIENHLGELWNLFRFINPGLLGSLDSFNQKFANPIERYQDRAAKQKLKKLIQPFILRRTKAQVLEELPSRTEITLQVELSREEMAFYEALRREALNKLANPRDLDRPQHLQVLAEIMKLRRACCNSRLVLADSPIPSAKLQLFGEVLEELLDNHHKVLVFSQFVDHLSILREHLEQKHISYQYLDGSTPAKERQKRVTAFQAGEGDVFLISLKAGGTGLNLTAADYVIHMDPWWNPAVEDQASDRAHRMGQQRPVTVYRLVAQGTIEEKIVQLHQHKRDLADSLLEGTEMSGKMSTEELLNLLQEA
jgi:superfamily II DNA or RNA helicase